MAPVDQTIFNRIGRTEQDRHRQKAASIRGLPSLRKSEAFSQRFVSATACFPELIFSTVRLPDLRRHCWGNEGLHRERRAELGCKPPGFQGADVQAWSCRLQDKGPRARAWGRTRKTETLGSGRQLKGRALGHQLGWRTWHSAESPARSKTEWREKGHGRQTAQECGAELLPRRMDATRGP